VSGSPAFMALDFGWMHGHAGVILEGAADRVIYVEKAPGKLPIDDSNQRGLCHVGRQDIACEQERSSGGEITG
jgi:hypothetical protein